MGDIKTKIAIYIIALIAVLAVSFVFSAKVEARDPVATAVSSDAYVVGGEPGEDPHLKVLPRTKVTEDTNPLGSYGGPVASGSTVTCIETEGPGERTGLCLGSRVNIAWRMILQAWLWTMHRQFTGN